MHKIIYYVVSHIFFRKLVTTSYSYAQNVYDDQRSRKFVRKLRLQKKGLVIELRDTFM